MADRTDTERLDWMVRNSAWMTKTSDDNAYVAWMEPYGAESVADTAREAIDAAMNDDD